jgi:hypothetical protein
MLLEQVREAPVSGGFVDNDIVSALDQLSGVAAQKMRVAVVPVRQE